MVAGRQHRSSTVSLTDVNENKLESFSQISNEAVNFFQKLIGTANDQVVGCSQRQLTELLAVSLPGEAHHALTRSISPKEVKHSMLLDFYDLIKLQQSNIPKNQLCNTYNRNGWFREFKSLLHLDLKFSYMKKVQPKRHIKD